MTTDKDIRQAFKTAKNTIESVPATNIVLRERAIADLKTALDSTLLYWANQNNKSQLAQDKMETEEERIDRIVAPYIGINVAGKKTLMGKAFPADIPMAAKIDAMYKIAELQALKQIGITEGAPTAGEEEKKTIAQTRPDAALIQSMPTNSEEDSVLRSMSELFGNSTIAGSVFGEAILGADKGATTLAAIDKALTTIQSTTSIDSLIKGGNMIDPHIAICIAFTLRLIDESEINLAHGSGLTSTGKGNKAASVGLTKTIVVKKIVEAVRPELLEAAQSKKQTNKK